MGDAAHLVIADDGIACQLVVTVKEADAAALLPDEVQSPEEGAYPDVAKLVLIDGIDIVTTERVAVSVIVAIVADGTLTVHLEETLPLGAYPYPVLRVAVHGIDMVGELDHRGHHLALLVEPALLHAEAVIDSDVPIDGACPQLSVAGQEQ